MKLRSITASIVCSGLMLHLLMAGSIAENCKRFATIVIPSVNFQKAFPSEAADFVNMTWRSTDPHVKGLDLKLAPGAFKGKKVTINATDIKLADLVGRIAEQLGAVVIIRSDSILLAPEDGEGVAPNRSLTPSQKSMSPVRGSED